MPLLLLLVLALLATAIVRLVRRERDLAAELAELGERVKELGMRLESAEGEVAQAVTQAEIAENVLLEKGVADEDDIEAVRRRFVEDAPSGYVRARDGELN
jgi:cell division septum initiation protein DivIVA